MKIITRLLEGLKGSAGYRKRGIIPDTNVFVAGYWNKKSASAKILKSIESGKINMLYSIPIKKEVFFILGRIKAKDIYLRYIEGIFSKGMLVTPKRRIRLIKDDPDDDKYIECACAGGAGYIISNDRHLLEIRKYATARIIRPGEYARETGL